MTSSQCQFRHPATRKYKPYQNTQKGRTFRVNLRWCKSRVQYYQCNKLLEKLNYSLNPQTKVLYYSKLHLKHALVEVYLKRKKNAATLTHTLTQQYL